MPHPDLSSRIIYPHSYAQFRKSGQSEQDLIEILNVVHLAYLPAREGGWHTVKEWKDVLSGGEKQRVRIRLTSYVYLLIGNRWAWLDYSITSRNLPYWMVSDRLTIVYL